MLLFSDYVSSNFNKRANKLTDCCLPKARKASCDLNLPPHILCSLRTKLYHIADDPVWASFAPSFLAQLKIRDDAKIFCGAQSPVLMSRVFHNTKT